MPNKKPIPGLQNFDDVGIHQSVHSSRLANHSNLPTLKGKTERLKQSSTVRMTASTDIRVNFINGTSPRARDSQADLSTHLSKKKLNEKLADEIKSLEQQIKQKYRNREKLENLVEAQRAELLREQENTVKLQNFEMSKIGTQRSLDQTINEGSADESMFEQSLSIQQATIE